jgi:uncharacterized damage-inducible protein DinB
MRSRPPAVAGFSLLAALVLASAPLAAQNAEPAGPWQRAAAMDMSQLQQKYVGLAEAMPESAYSWRPGDGVRSVAELFTHVAYANYLFGNIIGTPMPDAVKAKYATPQAFNAVTNKQEIVSMLRTSFEHARTIVATLPNDRFGTEVQMFGRATPVPSAYLAYLTHNHEHLGQAIAYARTNKVVPPWSGGN